MDFGGNSRSESKSKSDKSKSSSRSSSNGVSERTAVHISLRYGTKTIQPTEPCQCCGGVAEGVLKTKDGALTKPLVICEERREKIQEEYGDDWEKMTYLTFGEAVD